MYYLILNDFIGNVGLGLLRAVPSATERVDRAVTSDKITENFALEGKMNAKTVSVLSSINNLTMELRDALPKLLFHEILKGNCQIT